MKLAFVRRFWKKRSGALINVVVIFVVFFAISSFQARKMLPTSGQSAPSLDLATLEGGRFSLDGVGERPTLVYFFAPWCTYCKFSSDNLTRLRRWRDESDLEIVSVVLDWQSLNEVRDYAERHELNMPVLLGDVSTARSWKVYAFPTYYVLDSDQRIKRRDIGYSTQLGLLWRSWAVN
jgi:thiol-disulfide isomerase/thioredoxin